VLRKLAHFAAEKLVVDPKVVFDLEELPVRLVVLSWCSLKDFYLWIIRQSIIEYLQGTETELACEVSIRLMPKPQSGGGSRETRVRENELFLSTLFCTTATQVREKRKPPRDSEDQVPTRKSSRDMEKDAPGAVQQSLLCGKCSYQTHNAGPIAAAKELKDHLENSSACRRTQEGGSIELAPSTR
jgi:hypothetical protein